MINDKDIAVAFSPTGDTITWSYSEDVRITLYLGTFPVYEFRQGRLYVPGSKMNSYKNSWPVVMLPPRHRYFYSLLISYYRDNYEAHPTKECGYMCPRCMRDRENRQIFLYLVCIQMVPRILYIPHFRHRRTVSPTI